MSSKAPANAPVPQPPVAPSNSPLEEYVETNFKNILIGFCAIVVVLMAWGGYSYMSSASAETAGEEAVAAKTVEDCDLVVQRHPGTVAAGNALLQKASLLWTANKKDTSVATLRDFVAKYTTHPMIAQATLGLASRLEAMGGKAEITEAKGWYEKVTKLYEKTDVAALAQLRLADMLWAEGKPEEAKKVYTSLPQKLTGSPFFEYNEARLKWLGADLPTKEVEGPKPPPDSIKAPAPGAPPAAPGGLGGLGDMKLDSGLGGSPLGGAANNIKVNASKPKPVAIPATPKPGAPTPGAGIPVNVKPGVNGAPATATSAPVKVEIPAAAKPTAPPAPAPAPTPAPAKPAAPAPTPAAPAPAPATPAAPEKK